MLEKLFKLGENGTDVKTEVRGGIVTFLTMSYIIFVNPAILAAFNKTGMDFNAVMVATCISAALATLIMGLYANYPIAQAPLMGENAFFAATVIMSMGIPWQAALGAVFISGLLFLLLTFARVREIILDSVPQGLKYSIAAGIGLFIAFIGLQQGGIIVGNPVTMVSMGSLIGRPALLTIAGIIITGTLMIRRVKGAILWGMLISTVIALVTGMVQPDMKNGLLGALVSVPPSLEPTMLKLDLKGALTVTMIPVITVFLFMLLFDTVGTLIGVAQPAGLLRDGKLPRADKALLSDAVATCAGALMGTSTVSSYIESATGISEGARTGLANMVTGLLFLVALFFSPLVRLIGGGCVENGNPFNPITAPVLILVGCLMLTNIKHIDTDDFTETIPAFLTIMATPLTYNIAYGLALGFISYPVLKLLSGRGREVSPVVYITAVILACGLLFKELYFKG
ncbi:MAG: NCS2 family permease [Candidatus Eremiobacteraeota bacterium]|nr:NCS2 family permease [Candidatus Eremiobacteraeota bacterium]